MNQIKGLEKLMETYEEIILAEAVKADKKAKAMAIAHLKKEGWSEEKIKNFFASLIKAKILK